MSKEVKVDILLKTSELYRFTMHHTYFSLSGVFSLLISIGALVLFVLNFGAYDSMVTLALLIIGLTFTVLQPVMLFFKVRKQIKRRDSFAKPLHYEIRPEYIVVSQNDEKVLIEWPEVSKVISTKKAVYIYTSPVRAFIFPVAQCGGQEKLLVSMAKEAMEKVRKGEIVFQDLYHKGVEQEKAESGRMED